MKRVLNSEWRGAAGTRHERVTSIQARNKYEESSVRHDFVVLERWNMMSS